MGRKASVASMIAGQAADAQLTLFASEKEVAPSARRKYIPGRAQIGYRPAHDWTREEAESLYANADKPGFDRICYGDCIKGMENLPAESVDLVVADPPFGIAFDGKGSQYNRDTDLVRSGYVEVTEDYAGFSREWIAQLPRLMRPTASAYIVSGWTNLAAVLNAVEAAGLTLVNHLIWQYQFGVFTKRKFVSSHYHVLFLVKSPKHYFFNRFEYYPQDVWSIPRPYEPGQAKNGTKLPDELVERFIKFSSRPGDLVFDPFMGNGTTAVCAKALFRHFLGFEMNRATRGLHEEKIGKAKAGMRYRPLAEDQPSREDLLARYPNLKKHLPPETAQG